MNHTKKMNRRDRRKQVLFKHLSQRPNMSDEDKLVMNHYDYYRHPSSMKLSCLKVPGNYNHIGLFDEEHFGHTDVFKKHVYRRTKDGKLMLCHTSIFIPPYSY